eukprot:Blabericola_migrator_1__3234@NODE_1952_length_3515_cov_14_452146_g1245_i0_p1_GENE_NODE_1952_length_3515_cov_14_452146_g1245_i0NODE_1952_length_3515_cov_14_452146_g1245_i0_p1_ORF_typecomplete_len145_score12_16_NODE_1952_length_3515_cov_14_452146_g1245_i022802714
MLHKGFHLNSNATCYVSSLLSFSSLVCQAWIQNESSHSLVSGEFCTLCLRGPRRVSQTFSGGFCRSRIILVSSTTFLRLVQNALANFAIVFSPQEMLLRGSIILDSQLQMTWSHPNDDSWHTEVQAYFVISLDSSGYSAGFFLT